MDLDAGFVEQRYIRTWRVEEYRDPVAGLAEIGLLVPADGPVASATPLNSELDSHLSPASFECPVSGAVRTPRHLCDGHRSGSATAASKRSDRRAR